MKISELTDEQLEKIADNRPDWMADNRHEIGYQVPDEILKIITEEKTK